MISTTLLSSSPPPSPRHSHSPSSPFPRLSSSPYMSIRYIKKRASSCWYACCSVYLSRDFPVVRTLQVIFGDENNIDQKVLNKKTLHHRHPHDTLSVRRRLPQTLVIDSLHHCHRRLPTLSIISSSTLSIIVPRLPPSLSSHSLDSRRPTCRSVETGLLPADTLVVLSTCPMYGIRRMGRDS